MTTPISPTINTTTVITSTTNTGQATRYNNQCLINTPPYGQDVTKYSCVCSRAFNLTELYFCNGCQKLNCRHCVTEEIDCYYCPNCLDHVSVAEASQYGNRCKKCYDCPQCFSVLSFQQQQQGDTTTSGNTSPPITSQSSIFLYCSFCKWSSIGLDNSKFDALSVLSGVSLSKGKDVSTMQSDANKVAEVLQKEAADIASSKDSRTLARLKLAQAMKQLFNPSGNASSSVGGAANSILNSAAREERWSNNRSVASPQPPNPLMPTPTSTSQLPHQQSSVMLSKTALKKRPQIGLGDVDKMRDERIQASQFKQQDYTDDDISELMAHLSCNDANKINGLVQRYSSLSTGHSHSSTQLHPQHKQLLTRRSKRCRRCDKLLVKPDINPAKTEYKRQHFAFTYVPRVVVSRAIWLDNDTCDIQINFINPLHSYLFICFYKQMDSSNEDATQTYGSVADNAIPIEMLRETFIGGLLDETDDKDNTVLTQLKEKEVGSPFIVDRKDNKVTLRFILKVNPTQNISSSTNSIIDQHPIPTPKKQDLTKVQPVTSDPVKFTILLEFSSNSSLILLEPTTQKSIIPILFNIPLNEFDNTLSK